MEMETDGYGLDLDLEPLNSKSTTTPSPPSTLPPSSPGDKLTLFCVIEGDSTSKAFSIKASPSDNVQVLKQLIRDARAPQYDDIPFGQPFIRKVSIPDDPAKEKEAVKFEKIEFWQLKPTDTVGKAFKDGAPAKTIHIVVFRPESSARNRCLFGTIFSIVLIPFAYFIYMALGDRG
ncbi:hypothetical protein CPB97_009970 [Podila verticillata]|nr:hypothetical protein CPB97_009970 [Podila verticillata]